MSLLTDEQKERMRKATALRVLKDMSPSEIDETLQSLKGKLDAVEQELQDSKDARVALALTVMKLQERWWPFVHSAVCASDTARKLLHEANNAISDYQPILTKYNLEQQAKGVEDGIRLTMMSYTHKYSVGLLNYAKKLRKKAEEL